MSISFRTQRRMDRPDPARRARSGAAAADGPPAWMAAAAIGWFAFSVATLLWFESHAIWATLCRSGG